MVVYVASTKAYRYELNFWIFACLASQAYMNHLEQKITYIPKFFPGSFGLQIA
jgi:hypothetical protein